MADTRGSSPAAGSTGPDGNVLDPVMQRFLSARQLNGHPIGGSVDFVEARRRMDSLQAGPVSTEPAAVEDLIVTRGPTGQVHIRMFRPPGSEGPHFAILYLHGGFWVVGGKKTHDRLMRELVARTGGAVVFVDYTLAPEARYPIQIEQAYAVLLHIVEHAADLGLDVTRLVVAGDCAGGNLVAALTMLAKRRRGPDITLQVLFYPVVGQPGPSTGDKRPAGVPWVSLEIMHRCLDAYVSEAGKTEPTVFPLEAGLVDLNDLPSALIIVAEHDILRDAGEAYARRLTEAGVVVTCTRYLGTIHDFVVLDGMAGAAPTRSAILQAAAAIRDAFEGQ